MNEHSVGDFGNYYYGSFFLKEGAFTTDIYEPILFNRMVGEKMQDLFFLNYTPVPVFTALVYLPFTFLDFYTAKLTWNIFTICLFCFSLYRLARFYQIKPVFVLLYALALYIPFKTNLFLGQTYFLLFFLVVEGLLAYEKKRWITMGIFWGLAILIKIFPAFVFFFLLKQKNIKAIGILLLSCVAGIGLSMFFIAPGVWKYYLLEVLPRMSAGDINDPFALSYQSLDVLGKQLFLYDAQLNPDPLFVSPLLSGMFSWISKLFLLFLFFSFSPADKKDNFSVFSFTVLMGILISGYGSVYGFILLLFPLLALSRETKPWHHLCLLVICFLVSIPVSRFHGWPLLLAFLKLYGLLFLYVGTWWLHKKIQLLPTFILVAVFTPLCLISFITSTYNSDPLFDPDPPSLLAYDFRVEGHNIYISYRDVYGEAEKIIPLDYPVTKLTETTDPALLSRYKKSILVNDSIFYYLSDENRGVGLYTLRYRQAWAD